MKNKFLAAFVLGIAGTVAGCATILGGSSQTITVNSNVSGAQVHLNETPLGVTPLTANIKRGQTGVLRVTSSGHQPYQIALNKKISTLFWVNIFSGGVFGSTTDAATGAMYEYEPSTYMVSLQPLGTDFAIDDWRRREGLRGFVLLNSDAILADLAIGSGSHFDVLVDVLAVPAVDRPSAVTRWRSAYATANSTADFAEMLLAELR